MLANPLALRRKGVLGMNSRNVAYIGRYNPRHLYPLVDDKLRTKLVAQKAGVAVPELLHVIRTQVEVERIASLLQDLTQFVIKPARGSGGKGILVIVDRDDDAFVKSSGAHLSYVDIKRHLSNIISGLYSLGGHTDVAFVEALVRTAPVFDKISHEGVPDVRLIVFRGYPVMAMLRLATVASDGKANLHQGAVGVGIDMNTGQSIAAVQYNRPITVHPDSGVALDDIVVPFWRALLVLAARCFDATHLGYLGADLVLDAERGPLLLELNARPGLSIQIANDEGLMPRLALIESMEELATDIDERVDFAMQTFAREASDRQAMLFEKN